MYGKDQTRRSTETDSRTTDDTPILLLRNVENVRSLAQTVPEIKKIIYRAKKNLYLHTMQEITIYRK